jgi:hypothetical protein
VYSNPAGNFTLSSSAAKLAANPSTRSAADPNKQPLSRGDILTFHGQRASTPLGLYPRTLPPGGTPAFAASVKAVDGIGSGPTSYDYPTVNDRRPDRPASVLWPAVATASLDCYPLGVTPFTTRRTGLFLKGFNLVRILTSGPTICNLPS